LSLALPLGPNPGASGPKPRGGPPESAGAAAAAGIAEGNTDYSLLPADRSFAQAVPAFLFPYVAYVGLGSLSPGLMGPSAAGLIRLVVVAGLLWLFRKNYRLGPKLTPRQGFFALAASALALAIWVLAYRFSLALPWWRSLLYPENAARPDLIPWVLRAAGSTLWVPLFEELFCRAYLGELLFGLSKDRGGPGGISARLGRRMDARPAPLSAPPLSTYAVIGSAVLFSLGHDASAWIPAMLYFLFTSWVYLKTRSFRVCILVHGLVNLAIAGLVFAFPDLRFLW
jgi:CAAX protease family protein